MRRWSIGIVGGGPGGLLTAYRLEQLAPVPPRVTILEADTRLGGKIRTGSFASLPARYEIGAAEFYDYSTIDEDPLRDLIAELGLPTLPMGGGTAMIQGRLIETLDDLAFVCGSAACDSLVGFDRRAKAAVSPREFYESTAAADDCGQHRFSHSLEPLAPAARRFVESLMHSDLATEPAATSRRYGLDNYVMNDPAYMRLYCIAGGNEQLIDRLAGRLAATVRLRHRVERIADGPGGRLRVDWQTASGPGQELFDAVVIALPIKPLAGIDFACPDLAAGLGRHLAHHDHPGHYLRISMLFERPCWRAWLKDSYAMLEAFGGCCVYDETSREVEASHGVLGWLLGGTAARDHAALSDDELVGLALASLPPASADARALLRETRVHRWIGAVSGQPGGFSARSLDARHCPDPVGHPRLLLVGDYLFDSTLNGVLDSADYAAGWLATMMADSLEAA